MRISTENKDRVAVKGHTTPNNIEQVMAWMEKEKIPSLIEATQAIEKSSIKDGYANQKFFNNHRTYKGENSHGIFQKPKL